ncbi:MAG: NAD-binding protein [Propionibacteriaceae bacterium]|nr:NAD-binding protein [Propionibacteriaceae bacterium]
MPSEVPNVTTIFIVLRKMRQPLLVTLAIMTFAVIGLSLMPGVPQADGSSGRLSAFEAFYVFSYTATTIGFGEVPHPFSVQQRWWIIVTIYLSVVGWAYTIARLMSLLQDQAFTAAYATQAVRRTITHLREPFTIVVGYGYIGRTVARSLDELDRRIVVLDQDNTPIERLATDLLVQEVPGICGDARNPAVLGLAGLDHPDCEAVLALTGDEAVNLAVVMTCSLLRPGLPVIARATTRRIAKRMLDFSPRAVINPFDDFGNSLTLALRRPQTHRLISWLTSGPDEPLGPLTDQSRLHQGRWLVVSDDGFGEEVVGDLTSAGLEVRLLDAGQDPMLDDVTAVIAGSSSDTANLALAAHLRRTHPDVFIVVRQQSHSRLPLLEAFQPDSVFFPPALVTQRAIITLITPYLWDLAQWLIEAGEQACQALTSSLVERLGSGPLIPSRLTISEQSTPAVVHWLDYQPLSMSALFRSPQDWQRPLSAMPLLLARQGELSMLPSEDVELQVGDEIVMVSTGRADLEQTECLIDDSTLYYTATGKDIPTSGLWRRLTQQRWRHAFPDPNC